MTSCVRTVIQSVFAPIISHSPTSRPYLPLWLDDGYNNAICHLCIFLSRCIPSSIYLFLYRNSGELFHSYQCLKISRRAIVVFNRLFIDRSRYPSPILLSVLFVDKSPVCTPKAVCSFVWLCVQHGHWECICTDVRFDFQSPCLFFILFRFVPFLFFPLSYSGFFNPRGSLLSHPELNVHSLWSIIYYYSSVHFVLPTTLFSSYLLVCVACHVRQSPSILSCSSFFPPWLIRRDSLVFSLVSSNFLWGLAWWPFFYFTNIYICFMCPIKLPKYLVSKTTESL